MKISFKKMLATTFLISMIALPVMAQDEDMQNLVDRLERMDRDIKALNLKVYRGTGSVASTASDGEDLNGPLGARLSIRLNELENQMRQMTGQIEETAYRISQLNNRLDKLVADVDYRLTALEGGNPSARPDLGNTASLQGNQQPAPSGMKTETLDAPAGTTAQTAPKPGVLGTLNGKDLENPALEGQQATNAAPVTETANLTPEALYEKSRQMLMRSEFANAESNFKSFLEQYKDNKLTGNVRYWLGETYYVQGNYAQAASTFLEGYQKDPRGAKAPDSLLKLGMSLSRMDKNREACATYGKLRSDFPKMPAHLSKTLERERTSAKCN